MKQHAETLQYLRDSDLLNADEAFVFGTEAPVPLPSSSRAALFGAVGGLYSAIATTSRICCVGLSVGPERVRIFHVQRGTGKYLGTVTTFPREKIARLTISLTQTEITVYTTNGGVYAYLIGKRFARYRQDDAYRDVLTFIRSFHPNR